MNVCPEGVAYDSYDNETDRVNIDAFLCISWFPHCVLSLTTVV